MANDEAAAASDVVVVAVPWDGHGELLRSLADALAGKVVVDCVNPLGFDKQGAFALAVEEGSAAQQAASILPGSTVVAAFHHVSAALLDDPDVGSVDTDVLVLGDDRDAKGVFDIACRECSPRLVDQHDAGGTNAELLGAPEGDEARPCDQQRVFGGIEQRARRAPGACVDHDHWHCHKGRRQSLPLVVGRAHGAA
jgi:hypothetical protein